MKKIVFAFLALTSLVGCSNSSKWETTAKDSDLDLKDKSNYEKKVIFHRDSMSAVFYSGSNNVFPVEEISPVGRLNYFEVDEKYKVFPSAWILGPVSSPFVLITSPRLIGCLIEPFSNLATHKSFPPSPPGLALVK